MKVITVRVESDHLERIAHGRKPTLALAELIWNALDADATEVRVTLQRDFSGGVSAVEVRDNGTGITEVDAEGGFSALGGSWKRVNTRTRRDRRILHGKEGKGRFSAFSLGSEVTWSSRFEAMERLKQLDVEASADKLGTFRVSDVVDAPDGDGPGTDVRITAVPESVTALTRPAAHLELVEIFAFYLRQYPDVRITVDGLLLDAAALEEHEQEYPVPPFTVDGRLVDDAIVVVVEWRTPTTRSLYLCDGDGFALHALNVGIRAPGFEFTSYVRSAYVRELYNNNTLLVGDLNPGVEALHEVAKEQLREHFRRRSAERAASLVEEWKREDVYPYQGEAQSAVERSERQVFEIVASNVNTYLPDFAAADKKSKQFSLRLLRQAIESNPDSMQRILTDVLELPKQRQDELAELLTKTSLSSIIAASKVVADRLNVLRALEAMIYEAEPKKQLLERRQLHRILADHTWLFGEEYNLSVDDESLTEVLRKHLKLLGRAEADGKKLKPVKRSDGSDGIVDLMLSRLIPQTKDDEREHLVVELKRPTQKVDKGVVGQITEYALAVAQDERFRATRTRWVFWAVSNDLDDYARFQARQTGRPRGVILQNEEPNLTIWARSWGEIIEDCRARLTFFRKQLDYTADRETALAHLRKTHERYFPPVLLTEAKPSLEASPAAA